MMKKYVTIYKFIIILLLFMIVLGCVSYKIGISAPTKEDHAITFEVKENSTYLGIATELKEQGLIRSINFYKMYVKIFRPDSLQKGTYVLNQNMGVKKIIDTLQNGTFDSVTITFPEGVNMRKIADLISAKTSNTADSVYALLQDDTYVDELITNYWFLTDDIKNENIYYSLEGYLYPDTYVLDKDCSVKDIFKVMLDQMEKKLEPYKDNMSSSSYSIHEILTVASIVELEAVHESDRSLVASVFYNRLKKGMNLGSDVTAYYGAKVDMSARDLTSAELQDANPYNTRNDYFKTLPIGPICSMSISSIEAALNPSATEYLYFVADKNQNVYFTKTLSEHQAKINELKNQGLWYTWN